MATAKGRDQNGRCQGPGGERSGQHEPRVNRLQRIPKKIPDISGDNQSAAAFIPQ